MGSRSKKWSDKATTPGRRPPAERPRKQEVLNFTAAFWDAVRDRASRASLEEDYSIRKNRRRRRRAAKPAPERQVSHRDRGRPGYKLASALVCALGSLVRR
jgi:hypothetical protein